MASIRYDEINGTVLVNDAGTVNRQAAKPGLSFAFDRLHLSRTCGYKTLAGIEQALTMAEYAECVDYANASVTEAAAPAGPSLADIQAALCRAIDNHAGDIRQRYITEITGQDATYAAKLDEARRYQAAGSPADATGYPYIYHESQQKNASPADIASLYIATNAQWTAINAPLEGLRTAGKDRVSAAGTIADAQQAHDDTITAMDAIGK